MANATLMREPDRGVPEQTSEVGRDPVARQRCLRRPRLELGLSDRRAHVGPGPAATPTSQSRILVNR